MLVQLSAGFAGTERHAVELANALSADHDAALLVRTRPSQPHRHAQYDTMRRSINSAVRVFTAPRALPVPALWNALLRFRPDVVHTHYERSARVAGRWTLGAPVLATVHVHWSARDFARCDGLICLTEEQAAEVPPGYPGPRFVIGNWVVPTTTTPARQAAARAELGLPPAGAFVIGTVCRLEKLKGVAGLLAAFHAADLPNARLVVVGEGSERPALEMLAHRLGLKERIIFTGFRNDTPDLYRLFDVFVLNSIDETYGRVILEAAEADVPVIATATQGARAIAAHHPIRLVPIGDAGALSAALTAAKAAHGKSPRPLAGFGIADRSRKVLEAYRSILEGSSSRLWTRRRLTWKTTHCESPR